MTTLWDTTGSAVVKELAAQRRTGGAVLSGVALTLVVVADESRVAEAEEAATHAAQTHPCRTLVVVRRQLEAAEPRLDAEVLIGGRLGPGCTRNPSSCRCWPPTRRWWRGGTPTRRSGWPPTRWR